MAHFAELDKSNHVLRVIVVPEAEETNGCTYCAKLFGGKWIQTSYNGNIRKRFAGIGMTYNDYYDAFIPEQPYPSWTLNTETLDWDPPVPRPDRKCVWDEKKQKWQTT